MKVTYTYIFTCKYRNNVQIQCPQTVNICKRLILYILTFILSGDILRYGAIVLCRGQVKHFDNGLDIVPSVRLQSLHTERTRPLDNPNV